MIWLYIYLNELSLIMYCLCVCNSDLQRSAGTSHVALTETYNIANISNPHCPYYYEFWLARVFLYLIRCLFWAKRLQHRLQFLGCIGSVMCYLEIAYYISQFEIGLLGLAAGFWRISSFWQWCSSISGISENFLVQTLQL